MKYASNKNKQMKAQNLQTCYPAASIVRLFVLDLDEEDWPSVSLLPCLLTVTRTEWL